jgi:hypothetical protein
MGSDLTRKFDEFLNKMVPAGMDLYLALHPMTPSGETRTNFFEKARETAFRETSQVLEAIQVEARSVIYR